MTRSLPDVSTWLALAHSRHQHYALARAWFDQQPAASIAFCRVTQMGLLRLLVLGEMVATPHTPPPDRA